MESSDFPDRPFTRRDALAMGISDKALTRGVATGAIRRVVRGGYCPADWGDGIADRAAVIALVTPPRHVIRDRTAAWIYDIDTFTFAEHDLEPPIETCAHRGEQGCELDGVDGGTRDLGPDDVCEIGGVLVTTPLRTALDLACNLKRREAFAALNAFARTFGFTREQYAVEIRRWRGRRGVRQARELIGHVDPTMESPRESWTLLALIDATIPLPASQHWIEVDGRRLFRLDFAWVRLRVCLEYDGFDHHRRTPEQIEVDRIRRDWLREHGWTIIVIARGDFMRGAHERWISALREALRPAYSPVRF